jgi:hypothetical protein
MAHFDSTHPPPTTHHPPPTTRHCKRSAKNEIVFYLRKKFVKCLSAHGATCVIVIFQKTDQDM